MLISMRGTAMVFCLALGLAGCDATRELVKAPFDATTAVSNGTTQGASELTEPTKEFTSSTTPGTRVGDDNLIRAKQRLHKFAASNFDNLQHEIATGRGEYLSSLATLAQIPAEGHPKFFSRLQKRYSTFYIAGPAPEDLTHRLVDAVWLQPLGTHPD
ncbi:MAG: DUF3015 family protein [Nitrospira sp.]